MNDEAIETPKAPVAATAFGAEVEKVEYDLNDPRALEEAARTEVTLNYEVRCILSRAGHPCFRRSDTAIGTLLLCPKNPVPAEFVGKSGTLTIAVLPGTKYAPSAKVEGFVMPTKPVKFVRFEPRA